MQTKLVLATLATGVIVAGLAGAAIVYSGAYNIAADVPHSPPMLALMNATRGRSVEVRSRGILVPHLDDPQLVLKGAGQYAAMCTSCHLAPGMENSEIRPGLYPQPQNLSKVWVGPREAFWTIKHGLKMTAMPAWGAGHDDETIWSIVAFVQKLPEMTPAQYRELVAKAPPDDDMAHAPRRRAGP
jgi:mono/diheme cytochrome c family protein